MRKITIKETDVFLENHKKGQGKITISNTYGKNFSNFWGSMGETLEEFLCGINPEYFATKLLPPSDERIIDIKATFKNVRKYIREELDMPFYKEMEFQKDMREKLKEFQDQCEERGGKYRFVDGFHDFFVDSLDFYLIADSYDSNQVKESFQGICEHWQFLEEKPSEDHDWLIDFHARLKKELLKPIK
jgi:hypothetical protein